MDNLKESAPINIFWTGGWDSSFRLLYLLLVEEISVQPYYIVDPERKSTDYEFRAMETIKEELFNKFPKTKKWLLPTVIGNRSKIPPNETILKNWEQLNLITNRGSQFEWLPRYADAHGLEDLELCMEKKPEPRDWEKILIPELIGEGHECRIKPNPKIEAMSILKYFRFPLVNISKIEMEQIAKENSFFDILQKTWFCHKPKSNGKPCETCTPCIVTRESGCSHGLPKTNFIRDGYIQFRLWLSNRTNKISGKLS